MAAKRANPDVRRELLAKLGITKQSLSGRVKRFKRQGVAINTADAVHAIAYENGLDISKYLSDEEMEAVRGLQAQLAASRSTATSPAPKPAARRSPKAAVVSVKAEALALPGMTAIHAREAKDMAEKAYPRLYLFENSARDVITRVLRAALGEDWWEKGTPNAVQKTAADRQADESREPWHGRRGAQPIQYVDLPDLAKIVKGGKAWPHFQALDLFPRPTWFEELVADMNVSRRIVAHMNPLHSDDVKHIEATFRKWSRQLEARKDRIP